MWKTVSKDSIKTRSVRVRARLEDEWQKGELMGIVRQSGQWYYATNEQGQERHWKYCEEFSDAREMLPYIDKVVELSNDGETWIRAVLKMIISSQTEPQFFADKFAYHYMRPLSTITDEDAKARISVKGKTTMGVIVEATLLAVVSRPNHPYIILVDNEVVAVNHCERV